MSKEKKYVWLLTSGQYSDYTVHAAYPDEASANEVMELFSKRYTDSGLSIEAVELQPEIPDIKNGFGWWWVQKRDGKWTADEVGGVRNVSYSIGDVISWLPYGREPRAYRVLVIADTQERALKSGMEYITQFIANNPQDQ